MLETLLAASIGGAVLAAMVWAIVRLAPALSPGTRAMLWWCAAAKFVVGLVWVAPIAVPVLPAPGVQAAGWPAVSVSLPPALPVHAKPGGQVLNYHFFQDSRPDPVKNAAIQDLTPRIWAAGILLSGLLGLRRLRQILRALTRSSPAPPDVQAMAADLAARLGIRRAPPIRASAEVATPLVVGLPRPAILVPARFFDLEQEQQRMAICHELAHIRRRDLWLGCVPAIAERLFFFHPLAHLAAREYAFWREAACDAAVLETLEAAPQEYGRLLLDLGVSRPRASLAAAGAPWSFPNLKRRITMLRDPSSRSRGSRAVAALAIGGAILLVVPLQLTARQAAPPAAPAPAVEPAAAPAQPEAAPAAAYSARETRPAQPAQKTERRDIPSSRFSYVVFLTDERTHMSGSREDMARARQVRKPGEQLAWFRDGDREYVVRDPAVVQRIEQIWKPVIELGAEQGRIGGEQGTLGSRQAEIGTKQAVIGAEQGRLGVRQAQLGTRQAQLAMRDAQTALRDLRQQGSPERISSEKERQEIEAEMKQLDREMRSLGDKMRELEKPMRDLGDEMEALGREMQRLGDQMREAARKAQIETNELFERLISSGAAQRVK